MKREMRKSGGGGVYQVSPLRKIEHQFFDWIDIGPQEKVEIIQKILEMLSQLLNVSVHPDVPQDPEKLLIGIGALVYRYLDAVDIHHPPRRWN